jgi:serine/threonine protein kinase
MHSLGIAHLDVKPSHVLLAADGTIRLSDFSAASRVPATRRPRRTPLFAAPELFATSGSAGTAADAWSYGVLVYTLLAGFPPFFPRAGGNGAELREQVRAAARLIDCSHSGGLIGCPRRRFSPARSAFRRRTGDRTPRR